MKSGMPRIAAKGLLAAATALAWIAPAGAQIPKEFTNLKILPKDINRVELVGIMRSMAGGLGVRCNHCHVGPENLQGMDFATDEKATKRTARVMMKMVNEINGSFLKGIETDRTERIEVKCKTCHHRLTVPRPLDEIVESKVESDGVEAALEEYENLRAEYYGSGSYDFSPVSLNSVAERLVRKKKLEEAIALVSANVQHHPEDTWTLMLMAGINGAAGKEKEALAWYEKALKLDPENEHIKKQLERLRSSE